MSINLMLDGVHLQSAEQRETKNTNPEQNVTVNAMKNTVFE